MVAHVQSFWDGLTPDMQTAIVGALATVVAATLGVIAVVWQIGRQSAHAIEQTRQTEALKLKMQVYQEIVGLCRDVTEAEIELSSYVRTCTFDIKMRSDLAKDRRNWDVRGRAAQLYEHRSRLETAAISVIAFTERWGIIDPRIDLFRLAVNVALHDIREAFDNYSALANPWMPLEGFAHPNPAGEHIVVQIAETGEKLTGAINDLGGYIFDLQIEMQNLLLGELFNHRLPRREPIDPDVVVVRLDAFDELKRHFEHDTAWGKKKIEVEDRVRLTHAKRKQEPSR